jgi:hypothetical protein
MTASGPFGCDRRTSSPRGGLPGEPRARSVITVNIGDHFHPPGRADAVYGVVGVRADGQEAPHALLVADTPDQDALAVPLEILTDLRYWLPLEQGRSRDPEAAAFPDGALAERR